MLDVVPESNLEARLLVKGITGLTIRVTPYEIVTRIVQTQADQIVIQLRVYQADERRTQVILKNQGLRLVQYKLVEGVGWRQIGLPVTVWEDDFEPIVWSLFGPGKTVEEWYRARMFESMCHRPGSDSSPLDSSKRTHAYDGQYSTARMARHWA